MAFDDELHRVVKVLVINMNKIVDRNHYVLPGMAKSNLRHRPIGIGVQELADTFAMLRIPWESSYGTAHPAAKLLNSRSSKPCTTPRSGIVRARGQGQPYTTYEGPPASRAGSSSTCGG